MTGKMCLCQFYFLNFTFKSNSNVHNFLISHFHGCYSIILIHFFTFLFKKKFKSKLPSITTKTIKQTLTQHNKRRPIISVRESSSGPTHIASFSIALWYTLNGSIKRHVTSDQYESVLESRKKTRWRPEDRRCPSVVFKLKIQVNKAL